MRIFPSQAHTHPVAKKYFSHFGGRTPRLNAIISLNEGSQFLLTYYNFLIKKYINLSCVFIVRI